MKRLLAKAKHGNEHKSINDDDCSVNTTEQQQKNTRRLFENNGFKPGKNALNENIYLIKWALFSAKNGTSEWGAY